MLNFDKYQPNLPYVRHSVDPEAFKAYRAQATSLVELFLSDTLDNLGLPDNKITRKMLTMAWERGHSGGFQEVYYEMMNFTDLYDTIVEFNKG